MHATAVSVNWHFRIVLKSFRPFLKAFFLHFKFNLSTKCYLFEGKESNGILGLSNGERERGGGL